MSGSVTCCGTGTYSDGSVRITELVRRGHRCGTVFNVYTLAANDGMVDGAMYINNHWQMRTKTLRASDDR